MTATPIRLGTRGSALALAQAGAVAKRLGAELVVIESDGDRQTGSLSSLGGSGVFAAALRESLLRGEVDAVVHSYKDLPTAPTAGLTVVAIPKRADARDALCARDGLTLATLPEGARVGTGSPRRRAQLLAARPDLDVLDIRGNVDTRLARVGSDDPDRHLDAVVLAAAGLDRLERPEAVSQFLELDDWPTAPAQGALAIEVRTDGLDTVDHRLRAIVKLDHRNTRLAVEAERGVLAQLEAGCSAPIAAHALFDDGLLFLSARVYALDGSAMLTSSHALYPEDVSDPAADLAERVATELLAAGAAELAPLGRQL
ncbi:MAG TPA: hydroxymethylbilane synthase [Pseudolysinimonas sp.]|nr:hydroxymethylbilane synthase [Pseudolysinimonas sp.]